MAREWVKMRASLLTNPKVNGIARHLESDRDVSRALTTGFNGCMSEIVTRGVMRSVTVASLMLIWSAANEHTRDGSFHNADPEDIDDMVGIPGFARAMEAEGWLEYDEESQTITLPNFHEHNIPAEARSQSTAPVAQTAAERQRAYRERKKGQSARNEVAAKSVTKSVTGSVTGSVTAGVTKSVTCNDKEEKIEEKRRDINSPPISPTATVTENVTRELAGSVLNIFSGSSLVMESAAFAAFMQASPKKTHRAPARLAWNEAIQSGATVEQIMAGLKTSPRVVDASSPDKIVNPKVYLAERCWEDQPAKPAPKPTPVHPSRYGF